MERIGLRNLEKKIFACPQNCVKSNDAVLLGRLLAGSGTKIDILFLGMAPKPETYNDRLERRVFGEYGPTGKRIEKVINEIKNFLPEAVCWGTNCVKCNVSEICIPLAMQKCREFLSEEIKLLSPGKIILLGTDVVINFVSERFCVGKETAWQSIPCLHYYHPMERTGRFFKNQDILFKFLKDTQKTHRVFCDSRSGSLIL